MTDEWSPHGTLWITFFLNIFKGPKKPISSPIMTAINNFNPNFDDLLFGEL